MSKRLVCICAFSLFLMISALFVPKVAAQKGVDASIPHDLTVLRQSWRWTTTRSSPPIVNPPEPEEYQRDLRNTIEDNRKRTEQGLPPSSLPNPPRRRLTAGSKQEIYIYELLMKNTGNKKIKTITWEYVFFALGTSQELGRKKFVSKINVRSGEEKNIKEVSLSPPTYIITASAAGSTPSNQYSEKVIIRSIEYTDGSKWES